MCKNVFPSIKVTTLNCNHDSCYVIKESADSEIEIRLEFATIVTAQSRKERKEELCKLIRNELTKFRWIICGSVNIELVWYLHAVSRQETDKVGDLDNISKPILDSLTGEQGVLIDDSQIGSIHTLWMSRNEQIADNIVLLRITFNNDECTSKENLIFVQYASATCLLLNIDFSSFRDIIAGLLLTKDRLKKRRLSENIKTQGGNIDRMLVVSSWDIHRTRLSGFKSSRIYTLDQFKEKCHTEGLTWKALLSTLRSLKKNA